MNSDLSDAAAGTVFGGALGDALGAPVEFMSIKRIYRTIGSDGHVALPRRALYTDDTQLTIRVARALNIAAWLRPKELVRTLTNEYVEWLEHDPPRAPGTTCLLSVRRLITARQQHRSWTWATTISRGCGANMRVAPVAFISDLDTALGVAQLQAALTHGHPDALVASELTALAVRWAARGTHPAELPRLLWQHAVGVHPYRAEWLSDLRDRWIERDALSRSWRRCATMLLDVEHLIRSRRHLRQPVNPCRYLGDGWVADEAFVNAVYCAAVHADDPVAAISLGARTSGDSDSIASITGQVVGAYHGVGAWPRAWLRRIENRHLLRLTAESTARLVTR